MEKGGRLLTCMDEGKVLEGALDCKSVLAEIITVPMLDMGYSIGNEEALAEVSYALVISLGRVFKTLDAKMKHLQTQHWEQALGIFDAVLSSLQRRLHGGKLYVYRR
jgi:hypothetical protein